MKYSNITFAVLALLFTSTTVNCENLSTHSRHRHHHHHQQPQYFLQLEQNQRLQENELQEIENTGILDRVKAKLDKEEDEKKAQRMAQIAAELQQNAIKEAQVIARHQKLQNRLQYNEAKDQADSLITQIKSGTMDSTQLANIMMGQSTRGELSQSSEPEAQPISMPIAPPMVVEAPPPAPIVQAPAPSVMMMAPPAPPAPLVMMAPPAPPAPVMMAPTPAPVQMVVKPTMQSNVQIVKQNIQSMGEVEEKPVEMEDSISSIAQKVVEEKKQKEEEIEDAKTKAKEEQDKEQKVEEKIESEEEQMIQKKTRQEDEISNPLAEYYANQHPEVLATAKVRHYLTDQV